MSIWAVIPVKQLSKSKSRLRHLLTSDERSLLTKQLLSHTIQTLSKIDLITKILIVSPDKQIEELCSAEHVLFLPESPPYSLNSALEQAYQITLSQNVSQTLFLPSDLPFITTSDIYQMILTTPNHVSICSDYTGLGTNALFLPQIETFNFSFGSNSFAKHIQEIKKHQLSTRHLQLPSLTLDLDTEADWFWFKQPRS